MMTLTVTLAGNFTCRQHVLSHSHSVTVKTPGVYFRPAFIRSYRVSHVM